MAKNTIEKQKGALLGIGIAIIVLGVIGFVGGVLLIVFGCQKFGGEGIGSVAAWLMLVFGIILVIAGAIGLGFGIKATWVAASVKATRGSIAEGNIAKECGTPNGIKCPKCGATNTPGVKECQVCHTPLE